MSVQISPGSFINAAREYMPAFIQNVSIGSPWMEIIQQHDIPSRSNSPYYGPATQFLVDCFLGIEQQNPGLKAANKTPLERRSAAEYVMRNYIGGYTLGPEGLLARTYNNSDIATTNAHTNRFRHLVRDEEHILLGAIVPFDDMARTCGGAAIMLSEHEGYKNAEIVETITNSRQLQIIAGLDGTRTPELTKTLGVSYIRPDNFEIGSDNTVVFTEKALQVITKLISPYGCPTAKIKQEGKSLFSFYWQQINEYLLEDTDIAAMTEQLDKTAFDMVEERHHKVRPLPIKPRFNKKHPAASKRYTPPKR